MDGISVVSGIWFTILEENGFTICQQHRLGRVQESKSTGVISRQDQDPPMKKLEAWLGCHSAENTMSENKLQEKTNKQTSGSHIPALGTSELPGKWL
jgi:hypothetical protein